MRVDIGTRVAGASVYHHSTFHPTGLESAQTPFKNLRVPKRCAEPHPLGAARRRLGSQRFFPACPGQPLPSAQQVPGYSYPPRPLQAENLQHEPTSTSVPPAKSTTAVDPTGLRRHSEIRIAHDHAPSAARATQRPHHARNVSISRSTCIDSARSDSSAASLSASARIAAPAFRRAASIRAARTTADTGEPSLVKTSNALAVSSSGRNVIVSAIRDQCTTIRKTHRNFRRPGLHRQAARSTTNYQRNWRDSGCVGEGFFPVFVVNPRTVRLFRTSFEWYPPSDSRAIVRERHTL